MLIVPYRWEEFEEEEKKKQEEEAAKVAETANAEAEPEDDWFAPVLKSKKKDKAATKKGKVSDLYGLFRCSSANLSIAFGRIP